MCKWCSLKNSVLGTGGLDSSLSSSTNLKYELKQVTLPLLNVCFLFPGQVISSICVVWCPPARARGAAALPDSSPAAREKQPPGTAPGLEAAGRWPNEHKERGGVWRRAQVLAPTLVSPLAPQLFPNFPVAGRPSSPFAFVSAPKLFALPAPLPYSRSLLPAL